MLPKHEGFCTQLNRWHSCQRELFTIVADPPKLTKYFPGDGAMSRIIETCSRNLADRPWLLALAGIVALVSIGTPHPAFAGAFLNDIQSTGAASVSTAGQTAIAEDAAT